MNRNFFPTRNERTKYWDKVYDIQKMRWGRRPSEAAKIALRYLPTKVNSFLDLGCGYGRDIIYFKKNLKKVLIHGVDSSRTAFEIYKNYLNHQFGIEYFTLDLMDLNVRYFNQKYDVLFSNYLFHLFSFAECKILFAQINNLFKQRSLFISSFVSREDRHFGKGMKFDKNLYEIFQGLPWLFFNKTMIEELCSAGNLKIISIFPYTEIEFVCGNPDEVKAFLLIARSE